MIAGVEVYFISVVSFASEVMRAGADEWADAYTELGLTSSNEYGIKASMYNSNDILQASKNGKGKDAKLDGFFYSKKKDTGDWKALN